MTHEVKPVRQLSQVKTSHDPWRQTSQARQVKKVMSRDVKPVRRDRLREVMNRDIKPIRQDKSRKSGAAMSNQSDKSGQDKSWTVTSYQSDKTGQEKPRTAMSVRQDRSRQERQDGKLTLQSQHVNRCETPGAWQNKKVSLPDWMLPLFTEFNDGITPNTWAIWEGTGQTRKRVIQLTHHFIDWKSNNR